MVGQWKITRLKVELYRTKERIENNCHSAKENLLLNLDFDKIHKSW